MDSNNAGRAYGHHDSGYSHEINDGEDPDYYPKKLTIDKNIDNAKLSHLQKILLMTDGTVTELLEHLSREPIVIEKVYQELKRERDDVPASHIASIPESDAPVLIRKILLKGKHSNKNYIYAESTILVNSLPECFRSELIDSRTPIGKLWSKHKLETYKTDFVAEKEKSSPDISEYLSIPVNSDVLSRTYSVYSCGEKSMVITEKFSSSLFMD